MLYIFKVSNYQRKLDLYSILGILATCSWNSEQLLFGGTTDDMVSCKILIIVCTVYATYFIKLSYLLCKFRGENISICALTPNICYNKKNYHDNACFCSLSFSLHEYGFVSMSGIGNIFSVVTPYSTSKDTMCFIFFKCLSPE